MQKTSDTYTEKRFVIHFSIIATVILLCIGLASYAIDPFFQFRISKENKYLLNPRLVNPGILKQSDYNTVILGSSMMQNLNMSLLRQQGDNIKPIKIGLGAANNFEIGTAYSLVKKENVKSIIISIDIVTFNYRIADTIKSIKYPQYTYENGILNKLEYLYNYETCIRYNPVDIGLYSFISLNSTIPDEYKDKTNIDKIGEFRYDDDRYNKEDFTKMTYMTHYGLSPVDTENINAVMSTNLYAFIDKLKLSENKNIEYTFILPPYSTAYWSFAQKNEFYYDFIKFIHLLNKELEKHDNTRLVCYYDIDAISDLKNYADLAHFSPAISNFIVESLYDETYILSSSNIDQRLATLDSLVTIFNHNHRDWGTPFN